MVGLRVVPWAIFLAASSVLARSIQFEAQDLYPNNNSSHESTASSHVVEKRGYVPLRISSLGASIMSGVGSSTGDGLRKYLRDSLRIEGWDVDMVGSLHSGQMIDYEHDAVPGDHIAQLHSRLGASLPYKANIVIINCGTNDATAGDAISTAGSRMDGILTDIWAAPDMGSTCIFLSTVIPTTDPNGAANRGSINDQYRQLVINHAGEGKCIYLADMDPGGQQWLDFNTDYWSGETVHIHPNDVGHRKMAAVFHLAIHKALDISQVVAPAPKAASATGCDKFEGTGVDAGGYTQRGSGADDGIYIHDSQGMGTIWTHDSPWDRNQWRFARLFSRDYDDLVAWVNESATVNTFVTWANSADGNGVFNPIQQFYPDLFCTPDGLRFIDMTNDGLDDMLCIAANGDLYMAVNQGDGNRAAGIPPTFKSVGKIKDNEGYAQDRVVLADIDGDGRGDYGIVDDSGNVWFWRNGWIDDVPAYWQALGLRFTAKGMGDIRGVRFDDVNGDGRDDWTWVGDVGEVYTWTNARSCLKGALGDGLNVAWRQGTFQNNPVGGPTHLGMGSYVTATETYLRDRVFFARIYGTPSAFGNLGRQDYAFIQHELLSDGTHRFNMLVWKNIGAGGTKLVADGNKYCNMMGHADGSEDYVWTWSTGEMDLYANRGKKTISDSDPDGYWNPLGRIWNPPRQMNRRDLHLQDWDGDGDCDIIYVDPQSGAIEVFRNDYPETGTWTFTSLGNPAPGLNCQYTRGMGIFDLAVRFADLTGNKRADYLCIGLDGRVTGFLHNDDGSFENVGQIKFAEGKDRANLRWTDVNGDGLDDMIWIEKFTGDTYVWYNGKQGDPASLGGSSFYWRKQDTPAYVGNSAGTCEYFPDLDGNGRADEHCLEGTFTNKARTWLNPSCGLDDREGDDATLDGSLPDVPGAGGIFFGSQTLKLAVLGDSWASGVAYSDDTEWDGNANECMRLINAYGPQLAGDTNWLQSDWTLDFKFPACSGSQLVNIVVGGQLGQVGASSNPTVVVMTAGGNNANFGAIVDACFMRADPSLSYGCYYENGCSGRCRDLLQSTTNYVNNRNMDPNDHGLYYDLEATLNDIFANDVATQASEFWLFVTGYSHFFNVNTTECDIWSFAPPSHQLDGLDRCGETDLPPSPGDCGPHVVQDLRLAINNGQEAFMQVYRDVIANYRTPSENMHVSYVSVTERFGGYRFCEDGASFHDQYTGATYTWNLQYRDQGTQSDDTGTEVTYTASNGGVGEYMNEPVNVSQVYLTGGGGSGPSQGGLPGWVARTFHPTRDGHAAIKDAILEAMRVANVPGVNAGAASVQPSPVSSQIPTPVSSNVVSVTPNTLPVSSAIPTP